MKLAWAMGAALIGVLVLPAHASAQPVIFKKHTVVEFGDDTIDGDLSKPDGVYLEGRRRLKHQRLIRVRTSFRRSILRSVRHL